MKWPRTKESSIFGNPSRRGGTFCTRKSIAIAASFLVLASCAPSIDKESCISEYAQRGGTEQIVRWGYQFCRIAADESKSSKERSDALCAVKKIPSTPTELAFRQVVAECRKR